MMKETTKMNRFEIPPADISGKVYRLSNGWLMIEEPVLVRIKPVMVAS